MNSTDQQAQFTDLVSIGVPVRNAGNQMAQLLSRLVAQTYRNLEIIISDNNSDDETTEICKKYLSSDSRIKYFRHNETLSAADNFRFVFEKAGSNYFMWAAHDDRHSLNYVETLLKALQVDPFASLAFSDVAIFHQPNDWKAASVISYHFECDRRELFWKGLLFRDYIRHGYIHIYGLIRRNMLEDYIWPIIELGPDRPLLLFLWRRGNFIRAEGACFYCYKPQKKKSPLNRAVDTYASKKGIRPFPYVRLSWVCAKAAHKAELLEGRRRNLYLIFTFLLIMEATKQTYRTLRHITGRILRVHK